MKKYDYIVSAPDKRDYVFSGPNHSLLADAVSSPPSSDDNTKLTRFQLPANRIEDQETLGACCAFGITSAFERLVELYTGDSQFQASALFNYSNSRILDADELTNDNGTTLRSACSNLRLVGVCREATWPYTPSRFSLRPPTIAYEEARSLANAINYYEVIRSVDVLKLLIGGYGFYVSIGFLVYSSFETVETYKSGDVPDPSDNDLAAEPLGGHCVNLIGWDDTTQRFTFINQYGTNFGDHGIGTISYNYVMQQSTTPEIKVLVPSDDFLHQYNAFQSSFQKDQDGDIFSSIVICVCLLLVIIVVVIIITYFHQWYRSADHNV